MLSSATGVDLKQNLCTLVLHSVVEDFSLENIFIRLSIGWTDRRLRISNYLKVAKINLYRMTNIAITTPMIIKPKIPPTSIGRLFDDEDGNVILFKLSRKKMLRTVLIFCLKKKYRINYNNRNWYVIDVIDITLCTPSQATESIPWSHWYPFLQPCKQLPFILSHVWLIQFRLHRYRQFSP